MATPSTPVKPDPKEVKRAQALWHSFAVVTKYSVIAIAVALVLMAITLV